MLRRMTHALREQNWATILIEFVLLAAGVFLGIQAANWNASQQEQALEAEFIERLQRDFRAIDARLAESVTRWQKKTVAPVRLLADLEAFQRQGAWPRTRVDILRDLNDTLNSRIPAPRAAIYVMYASSSANQLEVALLQQEKALAVTALLEPGIKLPEGTRQ